MYLRATKRKNKDGSVVEYYQLAHNVRDPETKKPVANIIHSFGRADELDREELIRLCNSIARVCGVQVVDPQEEGFSASGVFPEDLKLVRTMNLGWILVIEALWERLGIGGKLREICKRQDVGMAYERSLLVMTANRLCEPESKLGVWDRWLSKVYLKGSEELKLQHMYRAMDLLQEHASEIEEHIFYRTANLFNLEVDLIFYDTTTVGFSIDQEDDGDGLRKYGKSKEGGWNPQVVVALAVTREGLPVRSWIFPGNTSDVTTVERVRADLREWNLNRVLFVADAGMSSEENRKELARACGKYLLATRMASVSEVKQEVLTRRGRYSVVRDNLHVKEVVVGDGERRRRYILCYNPKEAQRQKRHRAEVVEYLEQEIPRHKDQRATAAWAIELLASKRYRRYLTITRGNKIRIDKAKVREAEKYDGKWVLETNDDTINLEDAALGYKGLMVIERCFRSLKTTQIRISPVFHWSMKRIEAHIRICVLSLLIERAAEIACDKSWMKIRHALESLQVSEFRTNNFLFLRRNVVPSNVAGLLKSLDISIPNQILHMENPA